MRLAPGVVPIVTMLGAAGSVALLVYAGRHSAAPMVIVLMAGWVAAPYLALLWVHRLSAGWADNLRTALRWMMLLVTAGSVAIYLRFAMQPRATRPAAAFVAVPPGSLLLVALVLGGVALATSRRS